MAHIGLYKQADQDLLALGERAAVNRKWSSGLEEIFLLQVCVADAAEPTW